MGLLDPDPTRPKLVILGKPNPRKDEIPALIEIGRWIAHLDRFWETTRTAGVPQILREAYLKERAALEKPSHLSIIEPGAPLPTHRFVLIFTDTKFQKLLDDKYPDWRNYGWHITNNPKETKDLAWEMQYNLSQLGITLLPEDGG